MSRRAQFHKRRGRRGWENIITLGRDVCEYAGGAVSRNVRLLRAREAR